MVWVIRKTGKADPLDARISGQICRDCSSIGLVTFEAYCHCFKSLQQLKGVEGRHRRARVSKLNCSRPDHERSFRKLFGEDHIVKCRLGQVEVRESILMLAPG